MAQSGIYVQLDPTVQDRLAALAEADHRPVAEVAAEVLTQYVDTDSWEHRQIRQGLDELAAGKGVAHEKVVEWLASWGSENELPMPK